MFTPLYIYSYVTGALSTLEAPRRNERGASFTEYVVLLAAIVAVVAAGVMPPRRPRSPTRSPA